MEEKDKPQPAAFCCKICYNSPVVTLKFGLWLPLKDCHTGNLNRYLDDDHEFPKVANTTPPKKKPSSSAVTARSTQSRS
jgi:hypothetical protein